MIQEEMKLQYGGIFGKFLFHFCFKRAPAFIICSTIQCVVIYFLMSLRLS